MVPKAEAYAVGRASIRGCGQESEQDCEGSEGKHVETIKQHQAARRDDVNSPPAVCG